MTLCTLKYLQALIVATGGPSGVVGRSESVLYFAQPADEMSVKRAS